MSDEPRDGEIAITPAPTADDAGVTYIGHVETPWATRDDCPRNISTARAQGGGTTLHLKEPFRPGLTGLRPDQPIIILYWLDQARRDLAIQSPRHREEPTGVFNLRSPVRPNPIGMATALIRAIDIESGCVDIETLDCVNGTPLVDIKPWFETIDQPVTTSV